MSVAVFTGSQMCVADALGVVDSAAELLAFVEDYQHPARTWVAR